MTKRLITSTCVLAVYATLMFIVSSLPNQTPLPNGTSSGFMVPQEVKHFAGFAVLGMLTVTVVLQLDDTIRGVAGAIILSATYAVINEVHQAFIPTRVCSLSDMLINLAGCVWGILALLVLAWQRTPR